MSLGRRPVRGLGMNLGRRPARSLGMRPARSLGMRLQLYKWTAVNLVGLLAQGMTGPLVRVVSVLCLSAEISDRTDLEPVLNRFACNQNDSKKMLSTCIALHTRQHEA